MHGEVNDTSFVSVVMSSVMGIEVEVMRLFMIWCFWLVFV